MSRSWVTTRSVTSDDLEFLHVLWGPALRRGDVADQRADVAQIIDTAVTDPRQLIVVAEYDGAPAGAAYLRQTTLSPVNLEPVLQVLLPTVLPHLQRHGLGRALMEAALAYAGEHGIVQLATAAPAGSREDNRFMARLGFSAHANYRLAPVSLLRHRVGMSRPGTGRVSGGRPLTGVLAVRRSMRRAEQLALAEVADPPVS